MRDPPESRMFNADAALPATARSGDHIQADDEVLALVPYLGVVPQIDVGGSLWAHRERHLLALPVRVGLLRGLAELRPKEFSASQNVIPFPGYPMAKAP